MFPTASLLHRPPQHTKASMPATPQIQLVSRIWAVAVIKFHFLLLKVSSFSLQLFTARTIKFLRPRGERQRAKPFRVAGVWLRTDSAPEACELSRVKGEKEGDTFSLAGVRSIRKRLPFELKASGLEEAVAGKAAERWTKNKGFALRAAPLI